MSKRNVNYTKPDEPEFLKRMKKEIGYKEGSDLKAKFEAEPDDLPDDRSDNDDETPQIVVLNAGDLSKEEAEKEKAKLAKEQEEMPADLNRRIIFLPKKKNGDEPTCDKKKTAPAAPKSKKVPVVNLIYDDTDDSE